tara:strand:- start:19646 stop:20854 length:1209 start_codon:yes stop_codon:yes gene_type:complete
MSSVKLTNISELVTFNSELNEMTVLKNIEVVIESGTISQIGEGLGDADSMIDCKNKLVTPGFVDPHTHPVFFDGREDEFSLRLQGANYEEISLAGGGIINSIKGVRETQEEDLISRVKSRMDQFIKLGTTTIECKSGYGLNTESELKSLKVIDEVNKSHPIDMIATFLGGHAFPPEYEDDHDAYVDLICNEMIPLVANQGIAKFNDVFCENGYFTIEETRQIINAGKEFGLIPRIHADEFQDSHAAVLAAEVNCISADHLMAVSDKGILKMSENHVIATLLPGTTFFLGKKNYAPFKKLKDAGIDIALATDYNPGSCQIQSMPFILTLSCIYMKMTVFEAIKASTHTAARSLLLQDKVGSLEPGKNADIIIWDIEKAIQIPYMASQNHIGSVLKNGEVIFTA